MAETTLGFFTQKSLSHFFDSRKKLDFDKEPVFTPMQVKIITKQASETAIETYKNFQKDAEKLESNPEHDSNKIEANKMAEAQNALNLGQVAENENRLHNAMTHYTLAAKLNPRFDTLTKAIVIALRIGIFPPPALALDAEKAAIKEYGKGSEKHAICLHNLGVIYEGHGEHKKSEQFSEQAINIYKNILGNKHATVSMRNLAVSYENQNDNLKAELLFEEILKINQEVLGKEHPDTATSLNDLGKSYYSLGKYKKAESCFNDALSIRIKVLGENHPDTADTFSEIAKTYAQTKQYKESETLYKKAIKIYEESSHPHISHALTNLAVLYANTRRYDEAVKFYKQGIESFTVTLGPNHSNTKLAKASYERTKIRQANAESVASQ